MMEANTEPRSRILVVDDNEPKRFVLTQILRSGGFEIIEAACGTDALALVQEQPDLVVLDVDLPDINGMEVCRRIKVSSATKHIPVLHVSGKFTMGDHRAEGLEGGADGYLTEPVEPRELRAAVGAMLRIRRAELELLRTNQALRTEIAERQRIEHELRDKKRFLRQVINLNPSLIFAKDWEGRFTLANRALADIYGISPDELIGKTDADFNPDAAQVAKFLADDREVMQEVREKRVEEECLTSRAGVTRRFQTVKQPMVSPEGKALQVLAVCTDITDLKRTEDALRHATQRAENANRAKSEFLANMSHEIRTPMTAILGYADMLLAPGRSEGDRIEYASTIRHQGEHLLDILNDILDLSKIEAGKLTVERIAFAPFQVIDDAMSLMRVRAIEKKLNLDVAFVGPVPQTITTDPTRLRQILINLLGNALKFTKTGGVHIRVSLEQGADGAGTKFQVEVTDTGIGMSVDQVARLFHPFAQADGSTSRHFGGTGLGLTICKRLAQILGGDITCESHAGFGSRFTVCIDPGPLECVKMMDGPPDVVNNLTPSPARPANEQMTSRPQLRGHILVADDAVHNQAIVTFYLEEAGLQVTTVDNGRVACDKALAAAAEGRPFDAILMDMQMPELDGYAAAAMLRGKGYTGPIIAFTAHAMMGEREKCLRAGCSDYVCKPVDRARLIEVITVAMGRPPATNEPAVDSSPPIATTGDVDPVVVRFLPLFLDQLPAQVEHLLASLSARDMAVLGEVAHQLKGGGGMYGYLDVTESASRVESCIAEQRSLEVIEVEVAKLVTLLRDIKGPAPHSVPVAGAEGGK